MRTRVILGAVALVASLFATPAWSAKAPSPADEASDAQAVLDVDQASVDAEMRRDAAALQGILDDRFVCTFNAGKPLDKPAFIAMMTAGDDKVTQVLSERTVVVVQDTAVVVETDTIGREVDGHATSMPYRFTVTYVKRAGRWFALAAHGVAARR